MLHHNRVYLDYAATAPLDAAVLSAMRPYFSAEFANPSSIHARGLAARKALREARQKIAAVLGCNPDEVIFTSGGTESNNLALAGASEARGFKGHIITSAIEHPSVLEAAERLKERGVSVTAVGVDAYGRVNPDEVKAALRPDTFLVSIMYANNEIGTIQPISEIGSLVQPLGILMHADAVQAPGLMPLSVNKLHVDVLSLSAHKCYGPKGVGIAYVKRGTRVASQMRGGGQERTLRSGTENVPGIIGAAFALVRADGRRRTESIRLSKLRDWLIAEVASRVPSAVLTGHPKERLANNASFCFPGLSGEHLVMRLSECGFECGSGSACSTGSLEPSRVLVACGISPDEARGSLRATLGAATRLSHLKRFVAALFEEVQKYGIHIGSSARK